MIDGGTASNRLVGVKRDNRFKAKKFLQPIDNHVKARHSTIHNHGVNFDIFATKFNRRFV